MCIGHGSNVPLIETSSICTRGIAETQLQESGAGGSFIPRLMKPDTLITLLEFVLRGEDLRHVDSVLEFERVQRLLVLHSQQ